MMKSFVDGLGCSWVERVYSYNSGLLRGGWGGGKVTSIQCRMCASSYRAPLPPLSFLRHHHPYARMIQVWTWLRAPCDAQITDVNS